MEGKGSHRRDGKIISGNGQVVDFACSQRTTENREEWGRSVANAGGVPMTSS